MIVSILQGGIRPSSLNHIIPKSLSLLLNNPRFFSQTRFNQAVNMSSDKEQRKHDPTAGEQKAIHELALDAEKKVQRNPHPDFKKVEASRPKWNGETKWDFYQTKNTDWKLGDGANDGGECLKYDHVC